jgi:hypothetical protein
MKKIIYKSTALLIFSFIASVAYIHYLGIRNQNLIKELMIGENISKAQELMGSPNSTTIVNDSISAYYYRPPLFSSTVLEVRYNSKNSKITMCNY